LDDKREARAEGGRRLQREGQITENDLDMGMVVLVRGTKSSTRPNTFATRCNSLGANNI